MPPADLLRLLWSSLGAQRLRAFLTILGISVGIASVVLLGSIGEGTRQGVAAQFSQFGTTIVGVRPGRVETMGVSLAAMGGSTRPLTIDDALALRRVPGVLHLAPNAGGVGELEVDGRSRRLLIYGTVAEDVDVLQWKPRIGSFLPPGDPEQIPAVCVLGPKAARELFGATSPLGAAVRVGGQRYTVVGVMSSKGQFLGFDLDDIVIIPLARALRLFNRRSVDEIHIFAANPGVLARVQADVRRVLAERHGGEEDFTVTTQADMLAVIDEVLDVLTLGVLVIAAISVVVGALGILTILWVTVTERTAEIGLMKSIGASDRQVLLLFLAEAVALSLLGGAAGLGTGLAGGWMLGEAVPALWIRVPGWAVPVALGVSTVVGLLAGVLPARRAARLDPVDALRAE